jgi:hypothetical protein
MIGPMESVRYEQGDSGEVQSAAERLSAEPSAPASVCELTVRELDLQRRLVRDSLLLRPA